MSDFADLKKTHPYTYVQDINLLGESRRVLGAIFAASTEALRRLELPPGAAIITENDGEHLIAHFRNEDDRERFSSEYSALKLNDFLPATTNTSKRVDFTPADYNVAWTVAVCKSIDPRGDIDHLIEVCQKAGYKDFRVIYKEEDISVYLPKGQSPAFFYAINEQLIEDKREAGIEISTPRQHHEQTPHLRLV